MRFPTKHETYLRLRAFPRPLAALLAVAAVLSLAWATATAPLDGPDESAHFSYAQNLAENGHKPSPYGGTGTLSTEVANADYFLGLHPSVGIPWSRPAWSKADLAAFARQQKSLTPAQRKNSGGPNAEGKNPVLYYVWEAAFYRLGYGLPVLDRVFLLRLANIPLFLLTIGFTWLLAAQLFRPVWVRTTAAALVALQPMAAFMSGVVNPDTLLGTIWAAFAYLAVRLVLLGPSLRRVVPLGLLVVASFLTQGRGIALVAPAVLAVMLSLWRHRERYPRAVWIAPAVTLVGAIVAAVVLTRSSAYGGELTLGAGFSIKRFLSYVWQFYLPPFSFLQPPPGPPYGFHDLFVQEFIGGRFGALEVTFSAVAYALVQLVALLVIAGVVVGAVAMRRRLARVWDVALLLVTIAGAQMLLLHLVSYRSLVGGSGDPLIVGRYLIPLCAIYGVMGAFVARAAGRRFGPVVAAGLVAISLALQLGGLALTVGRFYG